MSPKENREKRTLHTLTDEENFIEGLGCWNYPSIEKGMAARTDDEYLRLLNQYIAACSTRMDNIGIRGCAFARRKINMIESKLNKE